MSLTVQTVCSHEISYWILAPLPSEAVEANWCYFFENWFKKLKCPHLLTPLGTIFQNNYWSSHTTLIWMGQYRPSNHSNVIYLPIWFNIDQFEYKKVFLRLGYHKGHIKAIWRSKLHHFKQNIFCLIFLVV